MENKNNTFEEIWKKLKESKKILIPLHPGPDGDSLGSCLAMKYVLEKNTNPKVVLISQDELSENIMEFNFTKEVEFGKKISDYNLEDFDLLIFLDHGTLRGHPEYIEGKKFPKNLEVLNIDHHPTNEYYGTLNYVNPNVVSCCSVLMDLFKDKNIELDKELTRRLFLGLCTDSGFFLNGNSLDSLKRAVLLIEKGKINYRDEFYNQIMAQSKKLKKLSGTLFINMEQKKIQGRNVAYSFISLEKIKEFELSPSEIRLGINFMQDLKDTDLIFTLSELEDGIKGSFRSYSIDTSLFSRELGGGGHKGASAFRLNKMALNGAIEKVLETIEKIGMHEV